jgi:hypothetical protein
MQGLWRTRHGLKLSSSVPCSWLRDFPFAFVYLHFLSLYSFDIPFAVTEYAEQSADQTAKQMPIMRANYAKAFGSGTENFDKLMQPRSHSVTVNPFHRPGQRPLPIVRMPNLYNGFVIPIMTRS